MEDKKDAPVDTKGADPKKKKVMIGLVAVAILVLGYEYFKNKNSAASTASTLVSGGAIDPLTGQPYQAGVGSLAQSTGAGIQGMGVPLIIKNIIHTSGGTGSKSTTTSTLPTTSTSQYPTAIVNNNTYNPVASVFTPPSQPAVSHYTAPSQPTIKVQPINTTPGTVTPVGVIGQQVSASQAKANAQTLSQVQQMRNFGL